LAIAPKAQHPQKIKGEFAPTQQVTMQITGTLVVLSLIGNGAIVNAISLRRAQQPPAATGAVSFSAQVNSDDVDYKVIEKTSIESKSTVDCLCKIGSFWHWRIKSCVEQGDWGYECGFFPQEHHNKVCNDGLKCEVLGNTSVKYTHPGAVPASCQTCSKEDKCLAGDKRHEKNCLKEYKLSGEACQTVRVTVLATASAKVTEKVTKSSTASATATATSAQEAEMTADGETASAAAKATADGKATVKAEASGKATAKAKATEKGTAEGKACVTIDEAKALLKLQNVSRIGAVLTAKVIARADEEAFDRAYAKALAAARKAGLLNAKEAAEAAAAAEAREHAALEAKGKAEEAAAWKAEAGAEKDAQDKAKAEALAQAKAKAMQEAKDAAAAAEKAAADAKKEGTQSAADRAAEAKAKAEAAAAAAAAIADVINPPPTQAPMRPTTPEPTNAPRKITAEQVAATLP